MTNWCTGKGRITLLAQSIQWPSRYCSFNTCTQTVVKLHPSVADLFNLVNQFIPVFILNCTCIPILCWLCMCVCVCVWVLLQIGTASDDNINNVHTSTCIYWISMLYMLFKIQVFSYHMSLPQCQLLLPTCQFCLYSLVRKLWNALNKFFYFDVFVYVNSVVDWFLCVWM